VQRVSRSGVELKEARARSASFVLPRDISELVHKGMDLGKADDEVFKRKASGKGNGTVGHLTKGVVSRTDFYVHAITMALIPMMNAEMFPGHFDMTLAELPDTE